MTDGSDGGRMYTERVSAGIVQPERTTPQPLRFNWNRAEPSGQDGLDPVESATRSGNRLVQLRSSKHNDKNTQSRRNSVVLRILLFQWDNKDFLLNNHLLGVPSPPLAVPVETKGLGGTGSLAAYLPLVMTFRRCSPPSLRGVDPSSAPFCRRSVVRLHPTVLSRSADWRRAGLSLPSRRSARDPSSRRPGSGSGPTRYHNV